MDRVLYLALAGQGDKGAVRQEQLKVAVQIWEVFQREPHPQSDLISNANVHYPQSDLVTYNFPAGISTE